MRKTSNNRTLTKTGVRSKRAEDYVKRGDGRGIELNAEGKRLLRKAITANGGNRGLSAVMHKKRDVMHEDHIGRIAKLGKCRPATWKTLYKYCKNVNG